jgi:hypothetical protein
MARIDVLVPTYLLFDIVDIVFLEARTNDYISYAIRNSNPIFEISITILCDYKPIPISIYRKLASKFERIY